MTQLRTISNNHMSPQCSCGHSKLISMKEPIGRFPPLLQSKRLPERSNVLIEGGDPVNLFFFLLLLFKINLYSI